jgi:hypothetical protein
VTVLWLGELDTIPAKARDQVYFVHPSELPGKLPRPLARSTGWLIPGSN